ncbi:MAG: hypothetical protein JSU94_20160 [Phycisphaerales bacterium]|nr:MAG: hypothetical protein JSU94_20160 [Phycisphaerales bacterium]
MQEYEKTGAGLHKEISSIFSGVPIPQNSTGDLSSGMRAQDSSGADAGAEAVKTPGNPGHEPAARPQEGAVGIVSSVAGGLPKAEVSIKAEKGAPWRKLKTKIFSRNSGVGSGRQKAMVLLIPILSIGLIFALTRVLSTPARTVAKPRSPNPGAAAANSDGRIDWEIPAAYPAALRDPMEMPSAMAPQPEPNEPQQQDPNEDVVEITENAEKLIVKGILHSEDRPAAVIGAEIVYEGDVVLGATVVKINPDSVEFSREGERWTQNVEP